MSSSRKELSVQKHSSIVTLAKEGYSVREIAIKTKIPNSIVRDTMKKLTDIDTFEYKKPTGRQLSDVFCKNDFAGVLLLKTRY